MSDKSVAELQRCIDQRDAEIARLQTGLTKYDRELFETRAEVARLTAERDEARDELTRCEYSNPFAEARGVNVDAPTGPEWERATRSVNKLLGETELERKRLAAEVTRLTRERDGWEEQAHAHYPDYQRMVKERDEARAYAVSCSTQAQELSGERDKLQAEVARLTEALARQERGSAKREMWLAQKANEEAARAVDAEARVRELENVTGPTLLMPDGSREPLENCPDCGAMGKARFAHLHVCSSAESELAQLRAKHAQLLHDYTPGAVAKELAQLKARVVALLSNRDISPGRRIMQALEALRNGQ